MMKQDNTLGGGVGTETQTATPGSTVYIKDKDTLYEELVDVEYDVYERHLDELVEVGYLERGVDDDEDRTRYFAREGVTWSTIAHLDCPVKKQILLCLIQNPRTFFVLYNTQKGKSDIVAQEMKAWASAKEVKVVSFLVVDNDKSLASQTEEGLLKALEMTGIAKVFQLSSNTKETVESVRTYIDAYAGDKDGDYKMPLVVALNNVDQIKKILTLMNHIRVKVETRGSALRYGVVFDEADKVYPPMRDREFTVEKQVLSLQKLLVDSDTAVYRLGFVTATDGDLLDSEDYPECANAYMYPVPPGDPNYRAIHLDDAVVKHVAHRRQDSNEAYAEKILEAHKDYFAGKVTLKDGTQSYRKTIVNGGSKTESMKAFAKRRTESNAYAMTVNMFGVTLFRPGQPEVRRSSKKTRLSAVLFGLYKEFNLENKPLFVIGRRKVDRGLGFHHAPPDGSEGLIWTDMILGRIDDKNTAVQKAGRLAGKVAHCPQYPGNLTWWTDERTANSILSHNTVVDVAGTKRAHTALQAVGHAKEEVPVDEEVAVEIDPNSYRIYDSIQVMRDALKILGYKTQLNKPNADGFYETSLNAEKDVVSVEQVKSRLRGAYGGTSNGKRAPRSMFPCYKDVHDASTLLFLIPIRPGTPDATLSALDAKHKQVV